MNKFIAGIALCIFLLLGGCSPTPQTVSPVSPTAAAVTDTPQPTPEPTNTSSPTPLPTHTFTPTPEPPIVQNCISIQSELPADHAYTGNLLLMGAAYGSLELYNLQSNESVILSEEDYVDHETSPDRTRIALRDYKTKTIYIFSADGKIIKRIPMRSNWGWLADWLDDQRIAIVMSEPSDDPRYDKYPASVVILDTVTGLTQVLPPDYPDIDLANPLIQFGGRWGSIMYNATLTRAVYAAPVSNPPPEIGSSNGYVFYSLTEEKKLAEIPNPSLRALPIWFGDGMQFILEGGDEFYRVSADGELEKLTRFNPNYIFDKSSGLDYLLDDYYSLSPDESRLAFWQTMFDRSLDRNKISFTLAILDIETGEVTDTCISSGHYLSGSDLPANPYPIWSPDGSTVAVYANYRSEEKEGSLVLIDLEKQIAYPLPGNWIPTGWLLAE